MFAKSQSRKLSASHLGDAHLCVCRTHIATISLCTVYSFPTLSEYRDSSSLCGTLQGSRNDKKLRRALAIAYIHPYARKHLNSDVPRKSYMDQLQATLIENEIKRIQTGIFEAWKLYMTWYTWFFGANLLALGWLYTQASSVGGPKRSMAILAAAFMIFNLSGVISSIRIRSYTMKATAKAKELSCVLQKSNPTVVGLDSNLGFPSDLGRHGATVNAVSLFISLGLWLYLFVQALS